MKTLAIISYDFSLRLPGGALRAAAFASGLPGLGWKTVVLTASPSDEHPPLEDGARAVYIPSSEREMGGGIRADGDAGSLGGNPGWMRALSALKQIVPMERQLTWFRPFRKAVRDQQMHADAVLTITAPYSMMSLGGWLAARLRIPHMIDLRDDWTDRYRIEARSAANRWLMDRYVHSHLRRANATSVVSPLTKDRLAGEGFSAELIPNGYVEKHFEGHPRAAQAVEAGDGLTLLHLGWLGSFRSLVPVLDAIALLRARGTEGAEAIDIHQVGLLEPEERRRIEAHKLSASVRYFGQVSHSEALSRMKAAQVLLAIPGHEIPAAVSGKLYEYLRARRPILLIAGPGAAKTVAEDAGVESVASPDDPSAIATLLGGLLEARRAGTLRAKSSATAIQRLERSEGVALLAGVLTRITQS